MTTKPEHFGRFLSLILIILLASSAVGQNGDGGPALEAQLLHPVGVALDQRGNLYVSEAGAYRIRKVDSRGIITTVAGIGRRGFSGEGGPAVQAGISAPHDLVLDEKGNLYFTDSFNHRIRKVDTRGIIASIAGTGKSGGSGDGGPALKAELNNPQGIAIDHEGNLLVADTFNHVIRRIDKGGMITTIAGSKPGYGGDGGPAINALLSIPYAVEEAPDGTIYISDSGNSRIRKIDSAGHIQHVVGFGPASGLFGAGFAGDGAQAKEAKIYSAVDIAFDGTGNLYISDTGNNRIRRVANGVITTIAGAGEAGFGGDGGKAVNGQLNTPQKLVADKSGNIYFADMPNNRIRKIDAQGIITTIAGSGEVSGHIYELER